MMSNDKLWVVQNSITGEILGVFNNKQVRDTFVSGLSDSTPYAVDLVGLNPTPLGKKLRTLVGIVLDRSGSMVSIKSDVIGGVNQFLVDQRELVATGEAEQAYFVAQFDTEYDVLVDTVPVLDVQDLTSVTFVPRGATALLDAMGRTIASLKNRVKTAMRNARPYDRVLMVVVTDGAENASKEFTRQQIFDQITELRSGGVWDFNFLAANQDAITVGQSYGINIANIANFSPNAASVGATFGGLSNSVRSYSTGGDSAQDQVNY
jgi:uncharacterized protein YegL